MECHRARTALRVASLAPSRTSLYLVALSENRVVSNQSLAGPRGPFLSVDSLERNMQKGRSQSLLPMTMGGQPDLRRTDGLGRGEAPMISFLTRGVPSFCDPHLPRPQQLVGTHWVTVIEFFCILVALPWPVDTSKAGNIPSPKSHPPPKLLLIFSSSEALI